MTTALVPTWTLGDRLAKARHLTGLAQKAFGARLDISEASVKRYEANEAVPKRVITLGWAVATGVSPEWLAYGEEHAEPVTDPVTTREHVHRAELKHAA